MKGAEHARAGRHGEEKVRQRLQQTSDSLHLSLCKSLARISFFLLQIPVQSDMNLTQHSFGYISFVIVVLFTLLITIGQGCFIDF